MIFIFCGFRKKKRTKILTYFRMWQSKVLFRLFHQIPNDFRLTVEILDCFFFLFSITVSTSQLREWTLYCLASFTINVWDKNVKDSINDGLLFFCCCHHYCVYFPENLLFFLIQIMWCLMTHRNQNNLKFRPSLFFSDCSVVVWLDFVHLMFIDINLKISTTTTEKNRSDKMWYYFIFFHCRKSRGKSDKNKIELIEN